MSNATKSQSTPQWTQQSPHPSPSAIDCFTCIGCRAQYPLSQAIYACAKCGNLLNVEQVVVHDAPSNAVNPLLERSPHAWQSLFAERTVGAPGPYGSGVWRYHEWTLPDIPLEHVITLGEGGTPLVEAAGLSTQLDCRVLIKQCGQSLSGSFKDLGMTVLVSWVNHLRQIGHSIPAIACASTGDTSAALAAYGAAAKIPTLVLLPQGKISGAQLLQPISHGSKVIAIDTDFDGCMEHVQRLCEEEGVYLANSKNSLRIEGQKTIAFEICQQLGWQLPDWVVIPGGNLGNVSALVRGFSQLKEAGITTTIPRVLCAQAALANPLYQSFRAVGDFSDLQAVTAGDTQASAIRIGNPVSFSRAVEALKISHGVVDSVTEQELAEAAQQADETGLFVCPHTAVALASLKKQRQHGVIAAGETAVVIATAHGLKFSEFKSKLSTDTITNVALGNSRLPVSVPHDYDAVKAAAF